MLLDAADRFAQDHAGTQDFSADDPIAAMGWALTLVPEDFGGVGGTLADLASLAEGLATQGVQLPLIERCAIAPLLLQAVPFTGARWLEALGDGSAQIAPLTPLSRPLRDLSVSARQLDIGFELRGDIHGVDVSLRATHHVLPARVEDSEEVALFLLPADRLPDPVALYRTMEGRRGADFRLGGLTVPAASCLARGDAARDGLARADDAALLLTAIDTVAALASLVQHTIAHLKERRQFGVALSSFQVLRHRVADMFVRYQAAKGLVLAAFADHDLDAPDLQRTLQLVKVSLAETARQCAEAAIQMHGGMGVSEEVLATRLAQRLIASEFRYGDRLTHSSRLLRAAPLDSLGQPPAHNPLTRTA
jgi:alkylation response protein AidB-like acyl-CoA dehydrogenase